MYQNSMVGTAPVEKWLVWVAHHATLVQLPGLLKIEVIFWHTRYMVWQHHKIMHIAMIVYIMMYHVIHTHRIHMSIYILDASDFTDQLFKEDGAVMSAYFTGSTASRLDSEICVYNSNVICFNPPVHLHITHIKMSVQFAPWILVWMSCHLYSCTDRNIIY